MLMQLGVGFAASFVNIVIHSLLMTALIRVARSFAAYSYVSTWRLARLMSSVVCLLMGAHAGEAAIWALTYELTGTVGKDVNTLYFAFVNYTTLGYGDIVPVQGWQLLGPITAMNGILLFGWSTAVIFEVLRRALAR
jgi:hypothetical protein